MNKEVEEASHSEAKHYTVPTAHQSVYRLASMLLCMGLKQHLDFFKQIEEACQSQYCQIDEIGI